MHRRAGHRFRARTARRANVRLVHAQDKQGNVWYMGEDSLELKNGHFVKASDSWQTGVNGAQPGIIMPGNPQPGDEYRQEYYPPGQALDQAKVLSLDGSITVPFGAYT